MNKSLQHELVVLQTHSDQNMVELDSISNSTSSLAHRVDILELHPGGGEVDPAKMQTLIQQAVSQAVSI